MPLGKVAEGHHNHRNQHFGNSGVEVQLLHEQFDEEDIHQYANGHNGKVTEQLHPSAQAGSGEGDVFLQQETNRKTTAEGNKYGRYVRTEGDKTQIEVLFVQYKVVADEVHKNIQRIGCRTAKGIAEQLLAHKTAERRVKEGNGI